MSLKIQVKTLCAIGLSLFALILTGFYHSLHASTLPVGDYQIRTVVIDAGHGGKDPGCHGKNSLEKHIALAIALSLGKQISDAHPGIKVIYTRDKDIFIPLHERAKIANRNKADLFISIHCNYIPKRNQARGTETYVMGLHRAKDNLEVAKRENAAILHEENYEEHYDGYDPDSPEGHIILSMFQNSNLVQSIMFAQLVEEQFANNLGRHSRGVKQAGFLVLRNTAMPSALIETGFLSHDEEEAFLSDPNNQDKVAKAIFHAFNDYKHAVEISEREEVLTDLVPTQPLPPVCYKIQLAASANILSTKEGIWKKAGTVETKKEQDYYKYLVGPFYRYDEATREKDRLRQNGFEGAFVVAYKGEERISVEDAQLTLKH